MTHTVETVHNSLIGAYFFQNIFNMFWILTSSDRNSLLGWCYFKLGRATCQFQDSVRDRDGNVTPSPSPVNFPRTRDQLTALTRTNPRCSASVFIVSSDVTFCGSSSSTWSHSNADSVWTGSWPGRGYWHIATVTRLMSTACELWSYDVQPVQGPVTYEGLCTGTVRARRRRDDATVKSKGHVFYSLESHTCVSLLGTFVCRD